MNPRYICKEGKILLCKSTESLSDYDTILFATRDLVEITIPSVIKFIEMNAFNNCTHLQKVEFLDDSELRVIEKNAFSNS